MAKPTAPPDLTLDRLREVLSYDEKTGALRWKVKISKNTIIGSVAGSADNNRYVNVQVDGHLLRAHVIAWWMHYGKFPEHEIDHENGNPPDNWISNLRPATRQQQRANARKSSANTSGFKGVTWERRRKAWVAQICVSGRHIHLGQHKTKESAALAYAEAATQYFGKYARAL